MVPIKVSGLCQDGDIHEVGFVHLSGFAVEAPGASTSPRLHKEASLPVLNDTDCWTFMNESVAPDHVKANACIAGQDNSHTGASQSYCKGDYESAASVISVDETSIWIPERLALNPKDVYIVHFSGHMKMWHRNYSSLEEDHVFVDRLLKSILS